MIYLKLFLVYFKIGLFGFGGGFAILSLIQHEVVEVNQWVTTEEFTDILAISQMTPGPVGINSATYIGYQVTGSVWGAVVATLATVLPSFIIVILIARFFFAFRNNKWIKGAFNGIRPAAVGMIASAALVLMNGTNFIDWVSIAVCAGSFVLMYFMKVHPIWIIVIAGVAGCVIY